MRVFRVRLVRIRIKEGWKPNITYHALLRWLERVDGVDLEAARERMNTPSVRRAIALGAGSVKCGEGRLVIEGGRIITVLTTGMGLKRETKERNKAADKVLNGTARVRFIQ